MAWESCPRVAASRPDNRSGETPKPRVSIIAQREHAARRFSLNRSFRPLLVFPADGYLNQEPHASVREAAHLDLLGGRHTAKDRNGGIIKRVDVVEVSIQLFSSCGWVSGLH